MRIGDIVCLRGESEAKRTCAYLTANGILEDHLWILEKGITGWKFEDMTTTLS